MPPTYYDDLSGDECQYGDDGGSSGSSSDEESLHRGLNRRQDDARLLSPTTTTEADHRRVILHLDIDCFYCQCEKIDRNLEDDDRPFAIGQKHIIVTSNYAARKYGVGKLESKDDALRKCPHLIIYDGSDLECYRKHGRNIYQCFRRACREIAGNTSNNSNSTVIACAKGSMDEMMADLTQAAAQCAATGKTTNKPLEHIDDIFIYGETSETTTIREDQSGATSTFVYRANHDHDNAAHGNGTDADPEFRERLRTTAASIAWYIRQRILDETGFTTTLGIASNPQMAKIASSLRKPATVNVLYPSPVATALVRSMPLRSITGLGSGVLRALQPALAEYFHDNKPSRDRKKQQWTVGNLLQLPKISIEKSLATVSGWQNSSRQMTELLLAKCRGQDPTRVVDDAGGLPQRVSVENSFRRGTLCSIPGVRTALDDLFLRLPRLVAARAQEAPASVPQTLALTVRRVVNANGTAADEARRSGRRRPFVTNCRQVPFRLSQAQRQLWRDLAAYEETTTTGTQSETGLAATAVDENETTATTTTDTQSETDAAAARTQLGKVFRQQAEPLLRELIFDLPSINVTRISLALSNFTTTATETKDSNTHSKKTKSTHFRSTATPTKAPNGGSSSGCKAKPRSASLSKTPSVDYNGSKARNAVKSPDGDGKKPTPSSLSTPTKSSSGKNNNNTIDPSFLAALPPGLAREVVLQEKFAAHNFRRRKPTSTKRQRIENYFRKK